MSLPSQTDILRCSYHARVDSEAWARAEMAKTAADPEAFERRLKEQLERKLSVWGKEIRSWPRSGSGGSDPSSFSLVERRL